MSQKFGVAMLATKFYAASDMGGGLEASARRLFRYLQAAGHPVYVLTRDYDGLPGRQVIDGVAVFRFPVWGRSPVMVSLSYLVQCLGWLVAHRRHYAIIHCHQSYAPGTVGALAGALVRKPVLVKIATADEFSERRELERLPLFRLRCRLLRRVDRFVVVNPRARQEFVDLGIEPDRIVHIPNAVEVPPERAWDAATREAARRRLGLMGGRIVVFVGRLSAEKNLGTLVVAWPQVLRDCPDAHLLLVGDGGTFRSVEQDLRRQAATAGLGERVHFTGRVDDPLSYLLAADLFVLPSSTEGMSNALLEAMAAGLPSVVTRIPGNAELIRDGENGLLVDKGDGDGLAASIVRLLRSVETAKRMALAARRTVEEGFDLQAIGPRYLALYEELLGMARTRERESQTLA